MKRYTKETNIDVEKYLTSIQVRFYKVTSNLYRVYNGRYTYGYIPTTGRWFRYYTGKQIKHYRSSGVKDFATYLFANIINNYYMNVSEYNNN
jgi:hypothetical protein|tara:strand:+ start:208 stop:483 length:276 start_codon:yes stop_codon:yes gene_type:complete